MIGVSGNISRNPRLENGRIIKSDGTVIFIYKGMYHRDNGPAVYNSRTGYAAYYKMGKLHNSKGPALINPELRYIEYWKEGKFIRREEYKPEEKGFINGGSDKRKEGRE